MALRALRKKRRVRSIWVDALCINQQDVDEKSRQISLMPQIYSRASQTLVWLGDSDEYTSRLFKMYWIDYHLKKVTWRIASSYANKYFRMANEGKVVCSAHNQVVVSSLTGRQVRPYCLSGSSSSLPSLVLSSVYVCWDTLLALIFLADSNYDASGTLQELLLSSDPLVCCGSYSIRWSYLADTEYHSQGAVPERSECTLAFARLSSLRYTTYTHYHNDIISTIKKLQATEAKDTVLGTIAILSGIGLSMPPLDYSRSVREIFTAATRTWLRYTKSLKLMYLAATGNSASGLPSWVVDWNDSSTRDLDMFVHWVKSRGHNPFTEEAVTVHSEQSESLFCLQLEVRGRVVDRVSDIAAGARDPDHSAQILCACITWLRYLRDVQAPATLPTAVQQLVALIPTYTTLFDVPAHIAEGILLHKATLVDGDLGSTPHDEAKHFALSRGKLFEFDEALSALVRKRGDVYETMAQLEETTTNETIFMSCDGRLGLCFGQEMEEGDSIAVLVGADYPVVLREAEGSGQFSFVGPASVYGMMDGELWPKELDDMQGMVLV